jgi:hypothetical protein
MPRMPIVAVSGFVLVSSTGKPRIILAIITASFNPPNCSSVASRKIQKNSSDAEMLHLLYKSMFH